MNSVIKKNIFSDMLFHIGQIILYTLAFDIVIVSGGFFLGLHISWITLPIAFILAIVTLYLLYNETLDERFVIEILLSVFVFIILAFIVGKFYDLTWDGNAYHKLAVGLLKDGWNPVKEKLVHDVSAEIEDPSNYFWSEVYCKGSWFFAASVYLVTGNIECGKVYTLMIMLCVFSVSYYYFKKKNIGFLYRISIAACLALNPISVQQCLSFYIDGLLCSLLELLIIALLMLSEKSLFDKKISYSLIFGSMIICGNIKFTGLLYGGVFCIVYFLFDSWKEYRAGQMWFKRVLPGFFVFAALAVVTTCFVGYSTYITNTIRHGSPTFPLTGVNKMDIMTSNSPFVGGNRVKNLMISLFSRLDNININSDHKPILKMPFSVFWNYEKQYLGNVDNRISGFGILFSGILVLSVIIILVYVIVSKRDRKYYLVLLNVIVCIGLSLVIKESWWARYAPYIYFVTIIALIIAVSSGNRFVRRFGFVLSIIIIMNSCIPLVCLKNSYYQSKTINSSLNGLILDDGITVYSERFDGIYYNLNDKHIDYVIDDALRDDEEAYTLPYYNVKWKVGR